MTSPPIATYREFWHFYLREHANPKTRLWHIAGTGAASVLFIAAFVTFRVELVVGVVIAGYAPAWIAHFFIEKNRPATFRYPLWSLISDFRMTGSWLTGALNQELQQAGVRPPDD